jgi:hypothetical protein
MTSKEAIVTGIAAAIDHYHFHRRQLVDDGMRAASYARTHLSWANKIEMMNEIYFDASSGRQGLLGEELASSLHDHSRD